MISQTRVENFKCFVCAMQENDRSDHLSINMGHVAEATNELTKLGLGDLVTLTRNLVIARQRDAATRSAHTRRSLIELLDMQQPNK